MSKRFTDTDKWKKPFFRKLPPEYKLLWLYICDDCDKAGIWDNDFEIAKIRLGCSTINENDAIQHFGNNIVILEEGNKWFVKKFVNFQYRHLKPDHTMHKAVLGILEDNNLCDMATEDSYPLHDFDIQTRPVHTRPDQGA